MTKFLPKSTYKANFKLWAASHMCILLRVRDVPNYPASSVIFPIPNCSIIVRLAMITINSLQLP